jgi:protein O-GlcNAc transferase
MTIKSLEIPQQKINSMIALFSSGETQEALDAVEALIKDYPNEPVLFNISGACYAGLGQLDNAIINYEKALSINPNYSEAHYNLAGTLQELGQLDGAVESYKKSLSLNPNHAEAHNNLGNTFQKLEQLDSAITSYQKSIAIKPDYVEAHYSLGTTFQELGQLDDAVKSYETVLVIKPNFAEMHNNLGVILNKLNKKDAALKSLKRALAIKPDFAEAHNNLGNVLKELDQQDAALKSYKKAIAIKPDFAEAHNNLGNVLKNLEQLDAAVKSFKKAIAIKPDYFDAHFNLGDILRVLGQLDISVKSYEKARAIKPDHVGANNNLGISLHKLDQLDEAFKSFEKAIVIEPDFAEAHNNLGTVLKSLGQFDAAVKSYEKALAIKPDFTDAYNNLGITYMDLGQEDKAIKYYKKALAINPDFADAHNTLGIAHMNLGQLDDAINCYKKALVIEPDYAAAHYNLGMTLQILGQLDEALISYSHANMLEPDLDYILGTVLNTKMHLCIWDDLPNYLIELRNKINNNEKVIIPFFMLGLIDDPELQRKVAEIEINHKHPKNHDLPRIVQYPKHKKIRIGYFSADFRNHPVADLTVELYEVHDRSQFEIYGFSYGPDTNDKMNLRIKVGVDHFYNVETMPHKDVAMLARSVELDIAVDLGGFTEHSRTGIFAMSVAPVQISYIGYIGTMGANYYDYLVADQTTIPKKNQKYYSEKIVYLPSYQVNDSTQSPPETIFTREDIGLPEEGFVFCCFNNTFKITPTSFDIWGRILEKVEGSVLLIYADNESAQINLTKEISLRGIDPSRLIFGKHLPKLEYLARYRVADLFLDTHPYNAGTTASDALRMGLPVLTFTGNSFVSREAASVINSANLPELITTTEEEYESLAIELATNPKKLKIIKDKLANNLPSAPLYNTPLFTKHLESAYRKMYDRCHKGLEPDHIYVEHSK